MEKKNTLRSVIAGALLVAMLVAVPVVLVSVDPGDAEREWTMPLLYFGGEDGMELRVGENGDVQLLVDVYVKNLLHSYAYNFQIDYDESLITPSDYETNESEWENVEEPKTIVSSAFAYNPELFKIFDTGTNEYVPENPFEADKLCEHTMGEETLLTLSLNLDIPRIEGYYADGSYAEATGMVKRVDSGVDSSTSTTKYAYYLSNLSDGSTAGANVSVKLGTLSFKVNDLGALSRMVTSFDGNLYYAFEDENTTIEYEYDEDEEEYTDEVLSRTPLVAVITTKDSSATTWSISYHKSVENSEMYNPDQHYVGAIDKLTTGEAAALFEYDFGSGLIGVEPLNKEITINAYRAYTYPGTDGAAAYSNLAIALGKYAPTLVTRYADGTMRTFTMNWGADNTADRTYNFTLYKWVVDATLPDGGSWELIDRTGGDGTYDPTAYDESREDKSTLYRAEQYFYYPVDGGYEQYPTPITVYLTVTPVTAVSISADGLTKNYGVEVEEETADGVPTYTVYDGSVAVTSFDALKLPDEIKIHTDVVSGAPSLYLEVGEDIDYNLPEWVPHAIDSTSTAWAGDLADILSNNSANWPAEGTYTFDIGTIVTGGTDSETNRHQSAVYGSEMQAKYPWLTVEKFYEIEATRTIYDYDVLYPEGVVDYRLTHKQTTAGDYQTLHTDDNGNTDYTGDDLTLQLSIAKYVDGTNKAFGTNVAFKVRMPNGVLIEDGIFTGAGDGEGNPITGGGSGNNTHDGSKHSATPEVEIPFESGDPIPFVTTISFTPGVTSGNAVGDNDEARAELRRWINLGGYYGISICENATYTIGNDATIYQTDADKQIWTEFFPVYVAPRDNYYEENKTYNIIGLNSELVNYYGEPGDTVTFPAGEYYPVITDATDGALNTHSATAESYGVMTTYNPQTGEQPGVLYTFTVEDADIQETINDNNTPNDTSDDTVVHHIWTSEKTNGTNYSSAASPTTTDTAMADTVYEAFATGKNDYEITRYNEFPRVSVSPEPSDERNLYADAAYAAYGTVYNKEHTGDHGSTAIGRNDTAYEPTLRYETASAVEKPLESLKLIYEGYAPNNILNTGNGEVARVTFDTQTEGYTVRQSFVLTLHNDGSTDIDGIHINTLLDLNAAGYNEYYPSTDTPYGGHFEITDPPASYLAAGAKTTFTVTYVYDLRVLRGDNSVELDYLDKIYIGSNAYAANEETALKTFDANFRVSSADVNRVTVIVVPTFYDDDNNPFVLGEAGVIVGPDGTGMDYSYTSTMRAQGTDVYIGTFPYEEYEVKYVFSPDVTNTTDNSNLISLYDETNYDDVYSFRMPANNVTVYVVIYEPTTSKLRPKDIKIYAEEGLTYNDSGTITTDKVTDGAGTEIFDICVEDNLKKMWKKSFTASELTAAGSTSANLGAFNSTEGLALMTYGSAATDGFDASTAHYLVVLDEEESVVQAHTILRKVIALANTTHTAPQQQLAALASSSNIDDTNTQNAELLAFLNAYTNDNIPNNGAAPIAITMSVYGQETDGTPSSTPQTVYDNVTGPIGSDDNASRISANGGYTATETGHKSVIFEAPEEGGRKWLVIKLSYDESGEVSDRFYYIEIVRRPSYSVTIDYGNSPVGMMYNTYELIEKDTDGTTVLRSSTEELTLNTDGKAMFAHFVNNRDFSDGDLTLPHAFTYSNGANNLSTVYSYNREAWIPYGRLYDPDSLTYTASYAIGIGGTNTDTSSDIDSDGDNVAETAVLDEYDTYEEYLDLDLDPHSLFVMIGEDFLDSGLLSIKDSSMREIDPSRVRVYIDNVALLDNTAVTEVGRFAGDTTMDIYLGTYEQAIERDGLYEADFWQSTHTYTVMQHSYDGKSWDVYAEDGIDTDDESTMYFEYTPGNFYPLNSPFTTLTDPEKLARLEPVMVDGGSAIAVRPGVYDLVYEFDDFDSDISGVPTSVDLDGNNNLVFTYESGTGNGIDPIKVVRKLVILGPVGDADADGTAYNDATAEAANAANPSPDVTSDETLIENRVEDPLGYEVGFDGANAFKFRTVDANNDRNVNNIDANELHADLSGLKQVYEPVNYVDPNIADNEGGASS